MKLGASIIAIFSLLTFYQEVEARELYRYVNSAGSTVIDYQVPAEYIAGGYEVLNDDGVVLRVVPRELTDDEKAAWSDQERREAMEEAEQERLRKWDESLMLRYSSVDDIESARERALRDLRIRLSILKSNKRSLKQQVENYQSQAADLERAGREVGMDLLDTIDNLQLQIEAGDRSIADREREIEQVAASYEKDIKRFEQLQEMVDLRKTLQPK